MSGWGDELVYVKAEGGDVVVGEIFVAGHVGCGDAELDDSRETLAALGGGVGGREMLEGAHGEDGWKAAKALLPCCAGGAGRGVAGGAVGGEEGGAVGGDGDG